MKYRLSGSSQTKVKLFLKYLEISSLTPVSPKQKFNPLVPERPFEGRFSKVPFFGPMSKTWNFERWARLMVPQRLCESGDNPWYEPPLPIIASDWPTMRISFILIKIAPNTQFQM